MSATHTINSVEALTQTLRAMSSDEIRRHAIQLASTSDELAWWRSTIQVETRLRGFRLSRRAAVAAQTARNAVHAAAGRGGVPGLNSDMVAAVSRAAADAARALVAGCNIDGTSFSLDCEHAAS
jgi:hypothetical protein